MQFPDKKYTVGSSPACATKNLAWQHNILKIVLIKKKWRKTHTATISTLDLQGLRLLVRIQPEYEVFGSSTGKNIDKFKAS